MFTEQRNGKRNGRLFKVAIFFELNMSAYVGCGCVTHLCGWIIIEL